MKHFEELHNLHNKNLLQRNCTDKKMSLICDSLDRRSTKAGSKTSEPDPSLQIQMGSRPLNQNIFP